MQEKIYPVILNGEVCGSLEVRRENCFTVFSVKTRLREGITRVSVYGGGREGYLGVLVPENGCMTLRRALSRNALRLFPEEIVCAGEAGLGQALPELARDEEKSGGEATAESVLPEGDIEWRRTPDGVLVGNSGGKSLVALLPDDGRTAAAGQGLLREIDGKSYLIYAVEDGAVKPL